MLTGREARTLPPDVVRGLFWRVYARENWNPAIAQMAEARLPPRADPEAWKAKVAAIAARDALTVVLWPEDDDAE